VYELTHQFAQRKSCNRFLHGSVKSEKSLPKNNTCHFSLTQTFFGHISKGRFSKLSLCLALLRAGDILKACFRSVWTSMAVENITNTSMFSLQCFFLDVNVNFTEYLFIAHILTLVVNAVSCFTAVGGNGVVVLAVWRTPVLHTPSNVFLCCLALSDLTVGLIAQPSFVIHKIGELLENYSMYCTTRILTESVGYITAGTSVLTMTGIAIERYLALYLHLRYKQVVTTKRILMAALCLWVVFILLAASRFWIANDSIFNNIIISVIFISLAFTFLAYLRVLKYVRRHENHIRDQKTIQSAQRCPVEYRLIKMKRYKKSTLTMVYILGIFLLCYIPFLCVKVVQKIDGYTTSVKTARLYASTIVFLNSSFNPLAYCWRIPDIRKAVKAGFFSLCFGVEKSSPVGIASANTGCHRRHEMNDSFIASWRRSLSVKKSEKDKS